MSKFKVTRSGEWPLKKGGTVEYYDVGHWSMELVVEEFDEELASAKDSIKVYKAWYRWLKKNRKKYKTP